MHRDIGALHFHGHHAAVTHGGAMDLRDAGRGLLWLLGRTAEMLQGKRRLSMRALGREEGPEGADQSPSVH